MTTGCDNSPSNFSQPKANGEFVNRRHNEFLFNPPPPSPLPPPEYPWRKENKTNFPPITKHHFRCHGKSSNPIKKIESQGEIRYISDCKGPAEHSLPIRNGKEFIYPVLIDLLNYLQIKSRKQVIVTAGHRCPNHHLYAENSKSQSYSKHMIGGEVDFYLKDLENNPEAAVVILQSYFQENPVYSNQKEYQQFLRWEKEDSDVSTPPWYNKEIFIKLYKKNEGRNLDNVHSFPYISIQLRYDKDNKETVMYNWDKAFRGFHRH